MVMLNRWWLSPEGDIMPVKGQSHIDEIFTHPDRFGTTKEHVVETYAQFGERIGVEGEARALLMKEAMEKGWVRVREMNQGGLYMETGNLDLYKYKIIKAVLSMVDAGLAHMYDPVKVEDWKTGKVFEAENAKEVRRTIAKMKRKEVRSLRLLKIVP